jgi:N utilization substance protein A
VSIDINSLKLLAAEKKLPLERLISAIENEVAAAYAALPEHKPHGRAVLNRETG